MTTLPPPPPAPVFSRDDEEDIAFYWMSDGSSCGVRCSIGSMIVSGGADMPLDQDHHNKDILNGLRLGRIANALRQCTAESQLVLRLECAPASFVKCEVRAKTAVLGKHANVMLCSTVLAHWRAGKAWLTSQGMALCELARRVDPKSNATSDERAGAQEVVSRMHIEMDPMIVTAKSEYAAARDRSVPLLRPSRVPT